MARDPRQTSPISRGSEQTEFNTAQFQKQSLGDFSGSNAKLLMSRHRGRNIPPGAETIKRDVAIATIASTSRNQGDDWRVKISVPDLATFRTSPLLSPLIETGNNVVFPLVPTIQIQQTANYESIAPVHTNYTYQQYVNSQVQEIAISGEFPVQNEEDGRYWLAATHFFRSVTKMFYGDSSNKGAPPPLCKLNGYGDFVFNNVPVVITSFTTDLPNQVDYIRVPIFTNVTGRYEQKYQMVPALSLISISVRPTYSRGKISTFSLDKFINGDLANKGFI
jgi:hypothetical protein